MSTVDESGLIALLPVYLDHVLNPTLTDASYTVAIHHINQDGEDSGKLYEELKEEEDSGVNR